MSPRTAGLVVALVAGAASAQGTPPSPPAAGDPEVVVTPPPTAAAATEAREDSQRKIANVPNPSPPIAGFVEGEGFRIRTMDGDWKLRVGLQAAASYVPTFVNDTKNWSQFRVPYARLRVDGNLFKPWIRYWFSFEFSGFPPYLLDGYIEAQPFKLFGVRVGQFFTPISRHEYLGPQELLFPDWAILADYFWTGRDKGIQLYGEGDILWWYFGLFAGSPTRQTTTTPGNYQVMGRVTVNVLGPMGWGEIPYAMSKEEVPFRFAFSLQGWGGKVTPSSTGFNPSLGFFQRTEGPERRQGAVAADIWTHWHRFGLYSEFYARRIEGVNTSTPAFWQLAWWGQANVTFYKRILDFAVRVNWLDPSLDLANDMFISTEFQLAWFIKAPYVTLRLRYAYAKQLDPGPAPAASPDMFDYVTLPLTPGNGHQLTVQLLAYF